MVQALGGPATLDLDPEAGLTVRDRDVGRAMVLVRREQRRFDRAVADEIDAGCQLARFARGTSHAVEAAVASGVEQRFELRKPGLWGERARVLVDAEQAERPSQVCERLTSGALDAEDRP